MSLVPSTFGLTGVLQTPSGHGRGWIEVRCADLCPVPGADNRNGSKWMLWLLVMNFHESMSTPQNTALLNESKQICMPSPTSR